MRSRWPPLLLKVTVAVVGCRQNGGGTGELASRGLTWAWFPLRGSLALRMEQAPMTESVKVTETQLKARGQVIQAQGPSLSAL